MATVSYTHLYEVTNLSEGEVVVPDYFTYLDDEFRKYKTFGDAAIGVTLSLIHI